MKNVFQFIFKLPSFTGPVFALALITVLGLTSLYSVASTSLNNSVEWNFPYQVTTTTETEPAAEATQVEPNWRYTKHGWQDANHWASANIQDVNSPFENIHPSLWATDIVLASIGALIWATEDEYQVKRLLANES